MTVPEDHSVLSSVRIRTAISAMIVVLLCIGTSGAGAVPVLPAAAGPECGGDVVEHASESDVRLVEGRTTAVTTRTVVLGGARQRLLDIGGDWCPASTLNVWLAAGPALDTVATARAAATVLATPYFVELTFTDMAVVENAVTGDVVTMRTHATSNGVVADWSMTIDAAGVKDARWTAVDFAVPPLEPQGTGLTALPGATMGYARDVDGLVHETSAPFAAEDQPEIVTRGTASDGFEILVSAGDTTVSPDIEEDTGIREADFYRDVRDWSVDNYEEFLLWEMDNRLPGNEGTVFVDDSLSLFCIACTVSTSTFNVHLSSQAVYFQSQLGMHYTDEQLGFRTILGHEIFHNFQHGYAALTGNQSLSAAFAEGTARMQEALHLYSEASYIPGSPLYQRSAEGCNGFQGNSPDKAFGDGPLNGRAEDACLFWMSWYGRHGVRKLVRLLEESAVGGPTDDDFSMAADSIAAAAGRPLERDLLSFAVSSIVGFGHGWRSPSDEFSTYRDWGAHLARWHVRQLPVGNRYDRTLGDGGIMAAEITGTAALDFRGPVEAHLLVLTPYGSWHVEEISSRRQVHVKDGDRAFAILIHPEAGSVSATIMWGMSPNAGDEVVGR